MATLDSASQITVSDHMLHSPVSPYSLTKNDQKKCSNKKVHNLIYFV